MISNYTKKLVDNLPKEYKNKKNPIKLDLVLDGGVFNGSYLFGALYFLKEMESQKYMNIERISSTSVGSIAGLIYFIDCLDIIGVYILSFILILSCILSCIFFNVLSSSLISISLKLYIIS